MWILASSQATSSPSIQILSDLVRGMVGYTLSQMEAPISAVVPVKTVGSCTALVMRAAASVSPRNSSIMAAERTAAMGFALPVPTMSGADPGTGPHQEGA